LRARASALEGEPARVILRQHLAAHPADAEALGELLARTDDSPSARGNEIATLANANPSSPKPTPKRSSPKAHRSFAPSAHSSPPMASAAASPPHTLCKSSGSPSVHGPTSNRSGRRTPPHWPIARNSLQSLVATKPQLRLWVQSRQTIHPNSPFLFARSSGSPTRSTQSPRSQTALTRPRSS
jgi:hypothetical protein